jgi:hypothetical protein
MDSDTNYYKDGVARVLEILKDTFNDYFKAYFEGTMDEIPESMLPCVMVTSNQGEIAADATGTDAIAESLSIIVAVNEKDFLGASGETALADHFVRHLVYGQDPDTSQYLPQSFMYALRKHFTLNEGTVDNRISFDFYPAQRGEQIFTREAILTLSISRLAMVPSRD